MTPQEALTELIARVGARDGGAVLIGSQELHEWPATVVAAMKAQGLLAKASPAASLVCPGCELDCVMPVHVPLPQDPVSRAFIVCDKRSDINRVAVPIEWLEQWQASGESFANLVANLLDVRRPSDTDSTGGRWEIGVFRGRKHASHLVLVGNGQLSLALAGHSIALADELQVEDNGIAIDRRALVRCVDDPVAGAGDIESAEARRERLKARVRAVKAKGTRAFLKLVAAEEGISVSRLKQILKA